MTDEGDIVWRVNERDDILAQVRADRDEWGDR